jgi:hypothetical protein
VSLPILGAEAALYQSGKHYRAAGIWTNGVDIQVGLSQLEARALGGTPIIATGLVHHRIALITAVHA